MESQMKSSLSLYDNVLKFINDFKEKHPLEIEDVFSNGYCYWFAEILHQRFNGKIFYLPIQNHFIVKIKDNYYDITGEVIPEEEPYDWEFYPSFDYLEYQRILRDCILKSEI